MGNYVNTIQEFENLPIETQKRLMTQCVESFRKSNPHFIIDSIEDMPQVIEKINFYIQSGFRPKNFKNTVIISKYITR